MKPLLSGGTTRQIAAIVIVSLIVAHGLSGIIWLSFDMRPGPPPEFSRPLAQIRLVLRLLEALPASDHAAVLTAAESNGLAVREGAGSPPMLTPDNDPWVGGIYHAIRDEPDLWLQVSSVGHEATPDRRSEQIDILVSLVSPGERWLLFQFSPNHDPHRLPFRWISPGGFASFVLVPLLVGLISVWAARGVTSPLVRLAAATKGLSILQDPSPIAEEGTHEVRQVARAFNEMVERLRRFVTDRTRMLAAISHDLRTPLTRLRLRAETVDDSETRNKMLNDIRTMESMITSTLAFIREEAAQEPIEQMDMAVLLQTICDEFSDAGSDVHYEGPLHCSTSCRPQALQRALNNLIDNAVKFGATATVRLSVSPSDIMISIEDDGPGISDAEKEAVFKPFFRGDVARNDHRGGSGLGLSIVSSIIASHNGRIELSDRVPHGLCVRAFIPTTQTGVVTEPDKDTTT